MIGCSFLRRRVCAIVFLSVFTAVLPARAQQAPPQVVDTVRTGISPGKAFVRSLIIPGWGQWSVGAHKRAAVFVALQSASWFMLIKTLNKISDARAVETERIDLVTDSLRTRMAEDSAFNAELSEDSVFQRHLNDAETILDIRRLIESRKQQRQDWITYTLFFTLASGVDAFVAAHLADFPATITTRPAPGGGAELKFTVPFPRSP